MISQWNTDLDIYQREFKTPSVRPIHHYCCLRLTLNPAIFPLPRVQGHPKQTPAQNPLEHLDAHPAEVLKCIHDFYMLFDTNQAERNICMMDLKQKISGSFCSLQGAHTISKRLVSILLPHSRLSILNKRGTTYQMP